MLKIISPKVEYMSDPLGIDVKSPRFSWQIAANTRGYKQTAYRIVVATCAELIKSGKPDMFDTGKVESDSTFGIEYAGKPLQPRTIYYWKAFSFGNDGSMLESDINEFETGMFTDTWTAEWIGKNVYKKDEPAPASPIFRKEFCINKKIKRARAYISGLGFYELYINGMKAGDYIIDPGQTDYERSVLYVTHDITDYLESENAVGVMLGRGRYSMATENVWGWHMPPWRDEPKFILEIFIEYDDGTTGIIKSDGSWKCADGPIRFDCLYTGEYYDARCELDGWNMFGFDDSGWSNAIKVAAPSGRLRAQLNEPVRQITEISPVWVKKIGEGRFVYDFGIMTSGFVRIYVEGPAGTEIKIRYSERLNDKGEALSEYGGVTGELQVDKYILRGKGLEIWKPRFSYKGFRFVELIGWPGEANLDSIEGIIVHSDVPDTGRFECSNPLFNRIHFNCRNAIANNLHGIPTDTPVYEKNGWTGDAQLTSQAAMYNYDMIRFYNKWIDDVAESQIDSGEICVICPTPNWGYEFEFASFWKDIAGPVPAWDAALMLIPLWCFSHYGDTAIIKRNYPVFVKYMDYVAKWAKDNIVDNGLGDWLAPSYDQNMVEGCPAEGPAVVSTMYYYLFAKAMTVYAEICGKTDDITRYSKLADSIRDSINRHLYNKEHKHYFTSKFHRFRQTNNAFALAAGVVEPSEHEGVLKRLVDEIVITAKGHLDTGIVGTKYLFHALMENGQYDLAYEIADKRTYPSYGFMIENEATSLWEAWELSTRSLNHHMFATIEDLFYQYFAGIKPLKPGFKSVQIKPCIPQKLMFAKASIETMPGNVSVDWRKTGLYGLQLYVNIPANTDGVVYVPVLDSFATFTVEGDCAEVLGREGCFVKLAIKSGAYEITSNVSAEKAVITIK